MQWLFLTGLMSIVRVVWGYDLAFDGPGRGKKVQP